MTKLGAEEPCALMPLADEQFSVTTSSKMEIDVAYFSSVDYSASLNAMREFSSHRDSHSKDQIWLLQHPSVYTQGTACEQQTLMPSAIPVVKTDRGGQITYHGPGQIVLYPLLNLRRYQLTVKGIVAALEQAVIDLLAVRNIPARRRKDAPGVYVHGEKIAALGLRIRRGHCYHGLSLNVDMDMQPFSNIDPCGYVGLQSTQLAKYSSNENIKTVSRELLDHFCAQI